MLKSCLLKINHYICKHKQQYSPTKTSPIAYSLKITLIIQKFSSNEKS